MFKGHSKYKLSRAQIQFLMKLDMPNSFTQTPKEINKTQYM